MPGKIKCSYDGCFQHFGTVEAMKKHKAKDAAHDYYCKKCDMDCLDDMELLYHQITSQKHVACPICGREFKSEAGRDRHVEIDHIPKQDISCVGCGIRFAKASSLMAHIELGQCEVIAPEDFHRQKVEKQIEQDIWSAALEPTAGSTILSNARQYPPVDSELNLLDDDRAFVNKDWRGRPQWDGDEEQNGPYVDPPSEQLSNLSVNIFPPLGPQSRAPPGQLPLITDEDSNPTMEPQPQPTAPQGAWANSTDNASRLFSASSTTKSNKTSTNQSPLPQSSATSVNLLDTFTEDDLSASNKTHLSSSTAHNTSMAPNAPSTHIPNPDPNHANAHIQTHTPLHRPRTLPISQFFDRIQNVYVCPSQICGASFPTPQAFNAHLLDKPHVGHVTCPGCYKRFKTTTALIAHVESGSRRCRVRDALDLDRVIRIATGGLLGVDGITDEGGVRYVGQRVEDW